MVMTPVPPMPVTRMPYGFALPGIFGIGSSPAGSDFGPTETRALAAAPRRRRRRSSGRSL